ncbi:MAG: peptide chain release factor N(5)-glutamine methyltransferase [Firmicutes bacterium]|nr:peptide chain release factor N(5)-glutamine methyltransferase [Bacillota bacterium]
MTRTFGEILNTGITRLADADIADAKRDAEELLLYITGESRMFLFMGRGKEASSEQEERYLELIEKRAGGYPLQYIVGTQEFMGLEFEVNENVLIPRQDTETLVELALEEAKGMKADMRILDMCSGSGAIAVSMAHFILGAQVTACDLSDGALEMTKRNAARNCVADRVTVKKSDMFNVQDAGEVAPLEGGFDMILSNPPYIETKVIDTLQTEVKDYEPMMALDGGDDGLVFYRILAEEAPSRLNENGVLIMEIGHDQGQSVPELLEKTEKFKDIRVIKDLPGLDRVVYAKRR